MIDLIFLRECKRIRKEYLDNLIHIINKEEEIMNYMTEIENVQAEMEENSDKIDEEGFGKKLLIIEKHVTPLQTLLESHKKKIEKLQSDSEKLYKKIIEKYPNQDFNEIKNEIINFIKSVDIDFAKNNVETYKKIKKRNNE